jgi:hypothetical protein
MEEDHPGITITEVHLPAGITVRTAADKAVIITGHKLRKDLQILLQGALAAHPVLIQEAAVEVIAVQAAETIAVLEVRTEAVAAAAVEAVAAAEEEDDKYYEKLFT